MCYVYDGDVTHKRLIKVARLWLRAKGCRLVLCERASTDGETPDAIGWKSGRQSILIECKASRADFRRDKDKWFRHGNLGMGQQRFFMAPAGVIPKNELPVGWGLLEVSGNNVSTVVRSDLMFYDEKRAAAEVPLLVACLRRVQMELSNRRKPRRLAYT
jgi:hypothetical protein